MPRAPCLRVAISIIVHVFVTEIQGLRGPCSIKSIPPDHDLLDTLLRNGDGDYEDYYTDTELDIIPRPEIRTLAPPPRDYASVEEGPFLEGDIIPSASSDSFSFSEHWMRWPNATVPFRFHNMMSYKDRVQVLRAMNEYHRHTCIQFKKRRLEKDYLVIGSSYPRICASSVGRQGGAQLLHLGPECTRTVGTPMHELMHALGFFHEHMRPDRDDYVFINYTNIDEALWKNFRSVHSGSGTMLQDMGVGYDFGSLMHYRLCAMTNNSWPTIVPKVKPKRGFIGQRKGFSQGDIKKLNNVYNCSWISRSPKLFPVDSKSFPKKGSVKGISTEEPPLSSHGRIDEVSVSAMNIIFVYIIVKLHAFTNYIPLVSCFETILFQLLIPIYFVTLPFLCG